jgi:hypothetical protein
METIKLGLRVLGAFVAVFALLLVQALFDERASTCSVHRCI